MEPRNSNKTIRLWHSLAGMVCLLLASAIAQASPVQVMECSFLVTNGPIPSESLTGSFTIRRHIHDADPYETTETDFWSEGKFADDGYFEVTVFPLEGNPRTERSTSVRTTLLDGNEFIGDSYLDEALTMEKTFNYEGYTLDSIAIVYERADGSAIDTHRTVPKELDPSVWDPYPGCGQFGCPVECAVIWHVPGDPQHCGTPNNPNQFCSTGSYIGRITSVTHEPHEQEHGGEFGINAGMNDAWVNADAPFQGLFITVYPGLNIVFVAWFTFDTALPPAVQLDSLGSAGKLSAATFGADDQRWVTAVGTIDGDKATLNAELTTGGKFNTGDPLPTQDTQYGTLDLEFSNCKEGKVTYNFPSAGLSGEFNIARVLEENAALCEALIAE
jgi:hypothetical protein